MNIFNSKIFIAIVYLFVSLSTPVYADSKRSMQYVKCMDGVDLGASKNSQWASCSEQKLKRQDSTLNLEYNKLRKSLSNEQRDWFKNAQRSWLKYREDWCRFDEQGPSAPGGVANYNLCIIEITEKQIEIIKNLQF